jgi:hypothetical protein
MVAPRSSTNSRGDDLPSQALGVRRKRGFVVVLDVPHDENVSVVPATAASNLERWAGGS